MEIMYCVMSRSRRVSRASPSGPAPFRRKACPRIDNEDQEIFRRSPVRLPGHPADGGRDVEVPGDAHRRGEHEGPLAPVRVRQYLGDRTDRRGQAVSGPLAAGGSKTGRISTPPNGAGVSLPISRAWSRSRASTM